MITIFTPSYNRKRQLENLYNSLLEQNYDDFEWLIVDDGSSDDTEKYIKKLKKENKIKINYVYKDNGGKSSAYNIGLDNAKGDIFLCIDSDDILKRNILRNIANDFRNISNRDNIAGIMYLQSYINEKKKVIGSCFPNNKMVCTYYDVYNKYNVIGDKMIVLKTSIARLYYFPIIVGEKFVPEALIFNRISLKYKFVCMNVIVSHKEYLEGGYSNNYFSLVKRNPLGNRLYFRELYSFNKSLYNVYGYVLFSIYGKVKFSDVIKSHPAKLEIFLLYIPTFLISISKK